MIKYYTLLISSVILTALALFMFKIVAVDARGEILKVARDHRLYLAVSIYFAAFVMWIVAASKIDYTVLVFSNTLGLIIGGVVGWYLFNEPMTTTKIVSYFLIISGVSLLIISNANP